MCLNSPSHGLALLKAGAKLRKLFGMSKLFIENYAKISRIAKNELFMSFSPQQR